MDARQPLHAILKFRRDSIFIRLAGGGGEGAGGQGETYHTFPRANLSFDEFVNNLHALRICLIDPINVTATHERATSIILLNLHFYFFPRAILII